MAMAVTMTKIGMRIWQPLPPTGFSPPKAMLIFHFILRQTANAIQFNEFLE